MCEWTAFSDQAIESLFATFEEKAVNGSISKEDFGVVFRSFFEDPDNEQVAMVLQNSLLMDRIFDFLDTKKQGRLSAQDLERVSLMFSADGDELISFRFFVYDIGSKGHVTREDMGRVVSSCFETLLKIREKDLAQLASQDQTEAGALEKFQKAKEKLASGESQKKIEESVTWAFDIAARQDRSVVSKTEFEEANKKNDDLFDWRAIAEDLCDYVDDISRLI